RHCVSLFGDYYFICVFSKWINKLDSTGIRSKEIISKLDEIDKRAESVPLSTSDGTKGRRKNRIFQMHNGDRMLYEDREYYKDLFGPPERLANGDWKTVETKFERNLCPTKRGARENRLFQITKNIGWQDGIKWLNVAIIKDLFMSKGTFQVKDGSQTAKISISSKNSTVAFVFSTDQDTFGLVIGGLGNTTSLKEKKRRDFFLFYLNKFCPIKNKRPPAIPNECPVTQYRLEMIMHISIERDFGTALGRGACFQAHPTKVTRTVIPIFYFFSNMAGNLYLF
ncbi:hypothetical protein ACJX0J_017238, partial [Zea mays]